MNENEISLTSTENSVATMANTGGGTKNKYSCANGHTFYIKAPGTWTTLSIVYTDPPQKHDFNYCWICAAQELVQRFPLTCEEVKEEGDESAKV